MLQILVYADSLSWGIVPNTRERLPFDARWPGVMEAALTRAGIGARVLEDCLNGRRTVFEDPYKPGRNGLDGLEQRHERLPGHARARCVDLGAGHRIPGARDPARADRAGHARAGILIVAPPAIQTPKGPIAAKFRGAETKCVGLATAYAAVARELDCGFLDAGQVTRASRVDGVHLDADQHRALGEALAREIAQALG